MKISNIVILLVVLAVLGGVYYVVTRPDDEEPTPTKWYLWKVEESDIQGIEIQLREGLSQAYYKVEDTWYCEDEVPVDLERWPGIQLLVSGPTADRLITQDATAEQLAEYGLADPAMVVTLTMDDGSILIIDVGDAAISGDSYYVKSPTSNAVGLVDYSWHDVLSGLVSDPRCSPATE